MHRLLQPVTILVAFVLISFAVVLRAQSPAGHWEGDISLPGTKLDVRVDLTQKDSAWSGTIDIPVQALRGFKLGEVKADATSVSFTLPGIPGDPRFDGKLDAEGKRITGEFAQSGQKFPFELARNDNPQPQPGATPSKGIAGKGLSGFWQGSLKPAPVVELRLSLDISRKSDAGGAFEGFMVSLDQGSQRIPLKATDKDGKIHLRIPDIGGSFEGTFNADGSELSGEWQQSGQKFPIKFLRLAKATSLKRPQEPQDPLPYDVEHAVVENKVAGIKLFGSFTIPRAAGRHPAVLLITGSGPQDRDETVMGHRPFLVLADHLTRQGFAVLRCDDRGTGMSQGDFAKATHTDFVEDALAGVAWLKARADVDPKRIGLVGHSEGGVVAPLVAVRQPDDVACIVLLAGVGVPLDELLVRQGMDLARVMGQSATDIDELAGHQRELFSALKTAPDADAARKLARESLTRMFAKLTPEQRKALGMTESLVTGQVEMVASPWFRKLIAYDPRPTLRQVKCPVLAINGEKDLQVSPKENLNAIKAALTEGGNTQVETIEFPNLNHLFQTCTTGAVTEYGQIEETFAPVALKAVSDWLHKQAGGTK